MAENARESPTKGAIFWRFLPLFVVLVAVGAVFATGWHRSLSFEALAMHHGWIRDLVAQHPVAMAALYLGVYIAVIALSIPASIVLNMTGGYLFGWLIGGALASVAATLGAAGIFLVARTSVGEMLLRRAGSRLQKLAAGFRAESFSYLLFLRLLPIMPFWITNLAAALFGMRFKTFVWATQLGVIPICYAFAVAGAGLDDVIAQQEQLRANCLAAGKPNCTVDFGPESLLTTEVMIALGLLGILAIGPIIVKKWQAGRVESKG